MSESTKKKMSRKNHQYNTQLVKKLAKKYGFTEYFIRQAIRGERNSTKSEEIRKEYNQINGEFEKKLDTI